MGSVFDERFDAVRNEVETGEEEVQEEPLEPQQERDAITLLRLGQLHDSFELYGHTFVMRTLNLEEEIAVDDLLVTKFASSINEKAVRVAYIAASLELVDGEPLVRSLGISEGGELSRAYDRVKKWYAPVVQKLYERYQALETRQAETLTALEKKDEPGLSS